MKRIKRIIIVILTCLLVLPSFGCSSFGKIEGQIVDFRGVSRREDIPLDFLLNIAYHNGDIERYDINKQRIAENLPDFKPTPIKKTPTKIKRAIETALLEKYKKTYTRIKRRNFKIEYFGEYNGYYIFKYQQDYVVPKAVDDFRKVNSAYGDDDNYIILHTGDESMVKDGWYKPWVWSAFKVEA